MNSIHTRKTAEQRRHIMDERNFVAEPGFDGQKKRPNWKKIAIIAAIVLVAAALVALLCVLIFGSSRTTPIRVMEKYENAREIKLETVVKDMLAGVEGNNAAKIVKLARKSDEFKNRIEELEEDAADAYEDNQDEYGKNFKIRYKNDKEVEEKLDRDELKDYKSRIKDLGEDYAALGKALGKLKSSELKDLAEDLDMSTKDLKECIDCLKAIGSKLKGAEVSEGYDLEYLITITGSELDEPEEDDGELTVLKVNGKWVSTQSFSLLYSFYYTVNSSSKATIENGGERAMEPQTFTEGVEQALTANSFTRSGYSFTGWNTEADGSGESYEDEASITPTADMTLYAQWKANAVKINTPKPEIVSSAGGKIISRNTEVTFTITQKVPNDATSMTIHYDLDAAMGFTSSARTVNVDYAKKSTKSADGAAYVTTIDGQKLSVAFADATDIRGENIQVVCKAKVKSGANLASYPLLTNSKTVVLIPYQARTDFKGAKDRTASSDKKSLKVAKGGSSSSGSSSSRRDSLANTGDPTSMAAIATLAGSGVLTVWTGRKMRKSA